MNKRGLIIDMNRWGADAPHVPAMLMKEGIVPGRDSFWMSAGSPDGKRIKQYLLYWDLLDWPFHDLVKVSTNINDLDMLEERGILRRTAVSISQEERARYGALRVGAIAQLEAFRQNNLIKGEEWAIADPSSLIQLPRKSVIESRTIEVHLHNQLFAPAEDVPTEEVLRFREKRAYELVAFRSAMYEFYEVLPAAADLTRAQEQAVLQIERSVLDLRKALQDTRWPLVPLKFQSKLDLLKLPTVVRKAFEGFAYGSGIGIWILGAGEVAVGALGLLGAGVNVAPELLSVKVELSKKPRVIPGSVQAYAYLVHAENELSGTRL